MGGFENYSHTRAFGECHPAVLSSVHIRCTDLEMACQSEVSRVTVAIRVAILNGYILDSTTILDSFQDSYQNSYHSSYHITDAKIAIIVAIIVAIIYHSLLLLSSPCRKAMTQQHSRRTHVRCLEV